jgi:hypothetical protein
LYVARLERDVGITLAHTVQGERLDKASASGSVVESDDLVLSEGVLTYLNLLCLVCCHGDNRRVTAGNRD